jgi:hypothetical protein
VINTFGITGGYMAVSASSEKILMVTLKDESQIFESTLMTTMVKLQEIKKKYFIAFFELVEKCKDTNYKIIYSPFINTIKIFKDYDLIDENEEVYSDVRSIVLNATEGSGKSMVLVDPLKKV